MARAPPTGLARKKMTSMIAETQFQTLNQRPSNHDRCKLCGAARSAHGVDWTCASGIAPSRRRFSLFIVVAGVVALAGIALLTATSMTDTTLGSLGASACLAGLTVLVCALALGGRQR
jgi:hypothetical protein